MIADPPIADALLAARLFAQTPLRYGGIVLRGFGPVRDLVVEQLTQALDASPVRIPINVDIEQLRGGLDLASTLAQGAAVHRAGLIEKASGGVAVVPMAERLAPVVAAHLAQAIDRGDLAVILLDDGIESDEGPPEALLERAAFHCDVSGGRSLDFELETVVAAPARPLRKSQRAALVSTAARMGIHSIRPVLQAERCAGNLAAMEHRTVVTDEDLEAAMRLVVAPRALQLPPMESPPEPPPSELPPEPEQETDDTDPSDEERKTEDIDLEDLLLEAAQAAIPQHILDGIAKGTLRSKGGAEGRAGQKESSSKRGRPRGSLPGIPGDGRKLALIDTLRAAAPWQAIRRARAAVQDVSRLHIRKSDLRIKRFEHNRESLTIFAVDASGSSALSRLAEAKGAVELMLAQAHVKRSQVALIAFRQTGAEVLLPPTRSLTRARRALGALPGGGGTPLAAGLIEARLMADAAHKRGQTPTLALLTDGKANVTLAGKADRATAMQEVQDTAKGIAAAGHHTIVIDIAPRPREEAAELASLLRGKYLPLPYANSAALVTAIESVTESSAA